MKKLFKTLACYSALALAPSLASAQGTKSFDICGPSFQGMSTLGFCAAADLSLQLVNNKPTVTLNLWNLSGSTAIWDPSYAWAKIFGIGLTNVIPSSSDVVNGTLKVTGPCMSNPGGCDLSSQWGLDNNWNIGGVFIDMFTWQALNGGGIVSTCTPNPQVNLPNYLYTGCSRQSPNYVAISFQVTQMFDVSQSGLFVKAAAPPGGWTYCSSNSPDPDLACTPITAAPEPATMALVGSGLAGMGFFRRRRKNKTAEAIA
jgi:hypothetical protein